MWPSKDTREVSIDEDGNELRNRPQQCVNPTEDGRFSADLVAAVTIASGRLALPMTSEDPDVGTDMIDLLRQAPQLLQACASMRVLKELRTISKKARALATSHISSFTVDCGQPVIASNLEHSLTLLRACSLRHLRVILDIQQHGCETQDDVVCRWLGSQRISSQMHPIHAIQEILRKRESCLKRFGAFRHASTVQVLQHTLDSAPDCSGMIETGVSAQLNRLAPTAAAKPCTLNGSGHIATLSARKAHNPRHFQYVLILDASSIPITTERLEEDLSAITSTLRDPMMAVTQLDLILSGVELDGNFTACEPSAHPVFGSQPASVLAALAPLCAPITHVFVLGQVETSFDFCIVPLLEVAQALCSASLTHITVDVPRTIDRLESGDDSGPLDMLPSFPTLNDDTCSMLRSLVFLTHLHLDGFIESAAVWVALPSTLISLALAFVLFGPEPGVVLPSLQRLALGQCGSSELALILKASPMLTQLDLGEVCSPSTAVAAADLTAVYAHPLLRLDYVMQAGTGAGVGAGLSTTKYGHSCNVGTSDRELQLGLEMPPWRVLPLLPAMPAILRCSFDCVHSDQGEGPPLEWDIQSDGFLHHLPRVFPSMTHLDLACAIRPDADFLALHACTSLISLRLSRCDQLTDGGLLAMAASLTNLVTLEVELCGCISVDAEEEVKHLMWDRLAAKQI